MAIKNLVSKSGMEYKLAVLMRGHLQYVKRNYQFNYIPAMLEGAEHIMTYADDKMMCEDEECFSFEVDQPVTVYILYPDIQPVLPEWMTGYERTRMNVTRMDSMADNLKGYFGVYKKDFPKGTVTMYGNSPKGMLEDEWYVSSFGSGYCMYSVCVIPKEK